MTKKMRSALVAVALACAVMVPLAGCSSPGSELVGRWVEDGQRTSRWDADDWRDWDRNGEVWEISKGGILTLWEGHEVYERGTWEVIGNNTVHIRIDGESETCTYTGNKAYMSLNCGRGMQMDFISEQAFLSQR
jgi:hypothetical protein